MTFTQGKTILLQSPGPTSPPPKSFLFSIKFICKFEFADLDCHPLYPEIAVVEGKDIEHRLVDLFKCNFIILLLSGFRMYHRDPNRYSQPSGRVWTPAGLSCTSKVFAASIVGTTVWRRSDRSPVNPLWQLHWVRLEVGVLKAGSQFRHSF